MISYISTRNPIWSAVGQVIGKLLLSFENMWQFSEHKARFTTSLKYWSITVAATLFHKLHALVPKRPSKLLIDPNRKHGLLFGNCIESNKKCVPKEHIGCLLTWARVYGLSVRLSRLSEWKSGCKMQKTLWWVFSPVHCAAMTSHSLGLISSVLNY